jgi:AraC family transcriptional regulator
LLNLSTKFKRKDGNPDNQVREAFMESKIIKVKGMVCRRCIAVVKEIFCSQGFTVMDIKLGEVTYQVQDHQEEPLARVEDLLLEEGFEILAPKEQLIIARVKEAVLEYVKSPDSRSTNFSRWLPEVLNMEYGAMSTLFSTTEGITLEKYIIEKRIERVRELLLHTQLTLADIAEELGYSSVAHLSNQFKGVTGLTPSAFRKLMAEED